MLHVDLWPEARDFIDSLSAKHQRQVANKLSLLAKSETQHSPTYLKGFGPLQKVRSGDYRIVYFIVGAVLKIPLIDKRGDDRVYRKLKRRFKNT